MSDLISEALAGFSEEAASSIADHPSRDTSNDDQRQAQHRALIASVHAKTVRIQREMRGRKNKQILAEVQEAVDLLLTFQDEIWPPRKTQIIAPPEWMKPEQPLVLEEFVSMAISTTSTEEETNDDDEDSIAVTTTTTVAENDSSQQLNTQFDMSVAEGLQVASIDDDPSTKEPVHDSVIKALQVYAKILVHPAKTNKACEWSLECVHSLILNRYLSGRAGGKDDLSTAAEDSEAPKSMPERPLLHRLMESITKCSESNVESIQTAVVKTMLAIMTSPKCGVHEATMLMAIRATFHVYLITKSPACREAAKSALLDMLRAVFNRMEAFDVMYRTTPFEKKLSLDQPPVTPFVSQYHTDAYLLFRALCKLSSKALPGEDMNNRVAPSMLPNFVSSSAVDPLALTSKILSLNLILAVMDYCGDAFCKGDRFIYAVQNYLCVSLLKNCMSTNTQVAYFSQKIFLRLVYKFKTHLKSEIEVFLSNIFLKVLESPNASFEQKALVLEALRALCSDPVLLTQIFLNYDCDLDAVNLYKDIVHNLTKLSGKFTASPSSSLTKKEVEQEFELSLAGIEVLVTILRAFLKALELPGGEDTAREENASARLRSLLQLDVGLAATPTEKKVVKKIAVKAPSMDDDTSVISNDPKSPTQTDGQESSSDVAGKIVGTFEMKRTAQQNFELGTVKFTLSLKSGIQYFLDNGFVKLDAREMALFFLENKDKLDKTQMGECLGREPDACFVKGNDIDPEKGGPGFWVRVLHHYAAALDFTGLQFDDAIRLFLAGFRLPGEAQKIDRIMEKFAERFTRQNLDVFPSADTAFILAFSVIMLNTDLHNPSIKPEKRMTVESFIRNNRGISVDGGDLPDEFLTGIFNRIQAQPFTLKEDDAARERFGGAKDVLDASVFDGGSFFGASAEERKREKFRKEREEMMTATERLFKARPGQSRAERASQAASAQLTDSVSPSDVVKPMFDVTWGPLIGTLSQVLECSSDERSIAVCLNGFVYAVRIAAHSNMSLARDTFVNSLAKFTFLGSIKEMKHKNIESIRTLLSIAIMDGEYLGESWGPVLQCISQLARLRLFASGLDDDESFLTEKEKMQQSLNLEQDLMDGAGLFRQPTKAELNREMEESNGRAVLAAVNEVLIDKVFSSTVKLSALSISHFIEQLVAVSAMEIAGDSKRGITGVGAATRLVSNGSSKSVRGSGHGDNGPRIFSLQRLVEVADYNMDVRPRLAWAQVWEIMAEHFSKIGCHDNALVSIFAIDSLKQLSFKFLEKPELSEFNFQRIFLRPFLQIMENKGTREDTRELILRCVDNMIRTISHNLRSGWKIFFSILTYSASDPSERINTLGLAILQRLLDEHLHQLCRLTDGEVEDTGDGTREITALERRNRNANVEDFVGLCRASLSFVQTNKSVSHIPIGLSMRALCHTACYADLLADHRVLPPVSGAQSTDPHAPGYTYDGLSEKEALEMVLWRSLLDGLAEGVRSTLPSNAGGVGCLVQRGSVLALRSILLRHGHMFSTTEWVVILKETLLPAIQFAAESDVSPVIGIMSESPSVSSLDFLVEPQRLPPPHDDEGLIMFAEQAHSQESAPKRPLGQAELLVEASFTDMRHGGDGNLSRAFELAKKDVTAGFSEQPFPDSWVATTAPIALGMLTDIASEIIMLRGVEGREILWPIVLEQFQLWAVERPSRNLDDVALMGETTSVHNDVPWLPGEALIRVACREFHRFSHRLIDALPILGPTEGMAWTAAVCEAIASTLTKVVTMEGKLHEDLVRSKLKAYGISEPDQPDSDNASNGDSHKLEIIMYTPYGKGRLVEKRDDWFSAEGGKYMSVTMNVIVLDFGATLYRPAPGSVKIQDGPRTQESQNGERSELAARRLSRETFWIKYVPAIKVRCVAAYCLEHYLFDLLESIVPMAQKDVISSLLEALNLSRNMAHKASRDEDLSHAFQEAMFSEWDDGVEEVEEVLSSTGRMSHRRGSAMFFLTQEAIATNDIVHMLAILYQSNSDGDWDRESFAEPFLLERMTDVLEKFLESEARDGHLIDPNVWRTASESGGKLAIYCTSFAAVVVGILKIVLALDGDHFARHKQQFFPLLCSLVSVKSDEIRHLVHEIMKKHVAPMIGVTMSL